MRIASTFLIISLALGAASTAHADPALVRRLEEIRDAVERARGSVPKEIQAADLDSYAYTFSYQFANMTRALEQAKGSYHPSLTEEGDLHDSVMAEQKKVEALHAQGVKLQGFAAAMLDIQRSHAAGRTAADGSIDALARGLDDFQKTADPAWGPHAARLRQFTGDLKARDASVATAAADRRARESEEAKREALQGTVRKTRARIDELKKAPEAGATVPADALAELEKSLADIDAQHPDGAYLMRADLLALKVLATWARPDPDAQQGIADLLGGRLDAKGRTQGKKMQVKVTAEADRCYLFLASWAMDAGNAEMTEFRWDVPKGRQVQQFHLKGWPMIEGFCAYQPEKLTATAGLSFVGTKNGVRWAVVSFPREQLPQDLLANLVLERGDWCDPVYWEAIWTKPVPGTIAYDKSQPVLMLEPETRMSEVITLNNPAGNHDALTSDVLVSKAPGALRFVPRELDFGSGCPANENPQRVPRAPLSLKKASCDEAVQKRYAKQWDHIEAQRAAARREGGIAPAVENRAEDLAELQRREGEKCLLVDDVAEKEIQKVNERLIDLFLEAPPADPARRAERFRRAAALRGW